MQTSKPLYILFGLLTFSWLQPLHTLPWVSLHSEVLAFVAVFFASIYEFLGKKNNAVIKLPKFILWVLLVALLLVMQYVNDQIHYFGDLIIYLLYVYAVLLALMLGYKDERPEKSIFIISYFVVAAGLTSALIMLLQALGMEVNSQYINQMPQVRRPGGNMGQPNHAATLLVMAIIGSLYLNVQGRLSLAMLLLLFFLLGLGLAMSESRSGLISFLILSLFLVAKNQHLKHRYAAMLVVSLVCLQQLLWWMWPPFLSWFWGLNSGDIGEVNRLSLMGGNIRLLMWREILEAVYQKPWLGWGWGQLPKALAVIVTKFEASAPFTYSHNIFLDVAVAFGVPALMLVVLGLFRIAYLCFIKINRPDMFWCVCLVVPVGIHSLLEFPHAYAYFTIPTSLLLGKILRILDARVPIVIKSSTIMVSTIFWAVLAIWVTYEYISLEDDFAVARFESMRIGANPPGYSPGRVLVLNQLEAMVRITRIKPVPNMSIQALSQFREVAQRFPSAGFQNRYALALALNNKSEEAMRQLKVIRLMQGEATYERLAYSWRELAATDYPQLKIIVAKAF